ncbi:MAG: hypothetical protein J6112_02890 [Clostridia bacterium]|nr:hypothetical protein [Clostridia bacterium]
MKTTYEFLKEKIQTVKPSFSYTGGDYAKWKNAAREKLKGLLGLEKFEKVPPRTEIEYLGRVEGAEEIRFTFESEEGYRVPCHLLLPDGVETPPLMICVQGHSTGMHLSLNRPRNDAEKEFIKREDGDYAVRAVKEGFAALALEQRNFGELRETDCMPPSMNNLLMGRTTIGERVWDISRVIDVIESEFADKVDTGCICMMGNSGGGTATAYTSALEDRLVLVISSCAMASYKDSIGAMPHCPCNFVPGIANYFDMNDLMAMACPKYFIQVSGQDDDIFPIFAAEKVFEDGKRAYDDCGFPNRCALYVGQGGHAFYADGAWKLVHEMLKR